MRMDGIFKITFYVLFIILLIQALIAVDYATKGRLFQKLYQLTPFYALEKDYERKQKVDELKNQKFIALRKQIKERPKLQKAKLKQFREELRDKELAVREKKQKQNHLLENQQLDSQFKEKEFRLRKQEALFYKK